MVAWTDQLKVLSIDIVNIKTLFLPIFAFKLSALGYKENEILNMFNAACKLYVNRNDYELRQLISGFLNQKLSNRIIDDHNRLYLIGNTTSAFSKLINRVDNLIEAEMRKPALNKLSRSSSKAEPTSFTLSTGDGILKTIDENIIEIQTQQECLNNISDFLASNEFKIYKFAKFKQSLNQFLEHVNSRIYRDNLIWYRIINNQISHFTPCHSLSIRRSSEGY